MFQRLYLILLSSLFIGGLHAMAPVVHASAVSNAVVVSGLSRFMPRYDQQFAQSLQVDTPQFKLSDQMLNNVLAADLEGQPWRNMSHMSVQRPRVAAFNGMRGLGTPTRVLYQQALSGFQSTYDQVYQEARCVLQNLSGSKRDKAVRKLRAKYHPDRGFNTELTHAIVKADEELSGKESSRSYQQQSQQSQSVSWKPWYMDRMFMHNAYTNLGKDRVHELLKSNTYKDMLERLVRVLIPERELFCDLRENFYMENKSLIENHFTLINAARPDSSKFESYNVYRSSQETKAFEDANKETQKILLEKYPDLRSQINEHFYQIDRLMQFNENLNKAPNLGGKMSFGTNTAGRFKSLLSNDKIYTFTLRVRILVKWLLILTGYGMYKAGSRVYGYLTKPVETVKPVEPILVYQASVPGADGADAGVDRHDGVAGYSDIPVEVIEEVGL